MKTLALLLCIAVPALAQDAPRREAVIVDGGVFLPDDLAVDVARTIVACETERDELKKNVTSPALIFAVMAGLLAVGLAGGIAIGTSLPKR